MVFASTDYGVFVHYVHDNTNRAAPST